MTNRIDAMFFSTRKLLCSLLSAALILGALAAPGAYAYADGDSGIGGVTDPDAPSPDDETTYSGNQDGDEAGSGEGVAQEPTMPAIPTSDRAGWLKDADGSWYYFAHAGAAPSTGWLKLGDTWYYLDPSDKGKMLTGKFSDGKATYICAPSGAMYANQWVKLDNSWYYAELSGALRTGWLNDRGTWYYFAPDSGLMAASEARSIGGVLYAFSASGALGTGWVKTNSGWCCADASGVLRTGWLKSGNAWYWLGPATGVMATGWQKVNGAWYYLRPSGAMATGWVHDGTAWYYLQPSGAMATGWLKDRGTWYYLQPSGAMATGWQKVNGAWYYLRPSGAMATGWVHDGTAWYFLQPSGAMATGWLKDRGTWYYLQPSGAMAANQAIGDGGTRYYLGATGALTTGWIKHDSGWYYAEASGSMATGWLQKSGTWYWLQPDKQGLMIANETKAINGSLYAFGSSGAMRANSIIDLGGGAVGYASSSGAIAKVGVKEGGKLILRDAQGRPLTGWRLIGGAWFYGEADGVAHTGWLDLDGKRYWMDADGVMATGTRTIDGKLCAFNSSGVYSPVSSEHAAMYEKALAELALCTNSSMTKEEKLWAAYKHIRDDFPEYNPRIPHMKSNGWENVYANDIFTGRGGNCLSCAAAMAFMAKAIGYDNVYACNSGGHGWAEIDGKVYDPEWNRYHEGTYFARPYSMTGGPSYKSAISSGYSWMHVAI